MYDKPPQLGGKDITSGRAGLTSLVVCQKDNTPGYYADAMNNHLVDSTHRCVMGYEYSCEHDIDEDLESVQ